MNMLCRIAELLTLLCLSAVVYAEPVDVRQGAELGSGYTFGRGETCTVLTAGHVVSEAGDEVTVTDRTDGRAVGQRVYFNVAYDLALVELPRGSTVACSARWPDTHWMNDWQPNSRAQFDVVRHYPGGRELLVALRYAGGTRDTLTLAFIDKLHIVASDSGSLALLETKPVGIVRRVLPDADRVDVLRFDLIDHLVGERFRGTEQGLPVALVGVTQRGHANANWGTFVKAWLTEQAGRRIVDANDPSALCRIGIDVIEWQNTRVENPDYASLNAKLALCQNQLLGKFWPKAQQICEQPLREKLRSTPSHLNGHRVMFNMTMTPRSGVSQTKLATVELIDEPGAATSGSDVERGVLQSAIAPSAMELFKAGICD